MIIDTHAHLNHPELECEVSQIVEEMPQDEMAAMICPGYDLQSSRKAAQIAKAYDKVFYTLGIHPHSDYEYTDVAEKEFEEYVNDPKLVGLGEIGLDYHYDNVDKSRQAETMLKQMYLAKKHNLPVIFHLRDAWSDFFDILASERNVIGKSVVHCFSGDREIARKLLDLGFYLSFTGVITYKSYQATAEAVEYVPLNRIFVETDCPYLAPRPLRGTKCYPKYVKLVAEKIAQIKGLDYERVCVDTTDNALAFFSKIKAN